MNKEEIFNEISSCFKMSVDMNGMKKLEEYITNLQKENEKNKHYKTLYQSLKRQKEELRSWLVEQEERAWDEVSSTFGYVLDKLEELEEGGNNE